MRGGKEGAKHVLLFVELQPPEASAMVVLYVVPVSLQLPYVEN